MSEKAAKRNWSDKETLELISLWSDDVVQEELEGPRNKDVYQRICAKLHEKGFERNISQCREKVKKLKKSYRTVVDNNTVTGRKRKTCKFYKELDRILGVKPATKPSLEISSEVGLSSDSEVSDEDTEESHHLNEGTSTDDCDTSIVSSPQMTQNLKAITSKSSSSSDNSKKVAEPERTSKPSKRRNPKTKLEKSLGVVIDKFMEGQKEIESRYMNLEEKRMKLELEMEKQRMEFEMKRREADRQHEMNMWAMLVGRGFSYGSHGFPQPQQFTSYQSYSDNDNDSQI